MRRRLGKARTGLVIAFLLISALALLLNVGVASAADPVTVKLTQRAEGDVTVVDVAITNSTSEVLQLEIYGLLPSGSTLVATTPTAKVVGGAVYWSQSRASANKTLVGYQYKFRGAGSTSVRVDYIGKTRGSVTATADAAAAPRAELAVTATKAPAAKLMIVPVPANAANEYAIKVTLPGTTSTVALGTTGLPNVSVGVPQVLKAESTDPAGPAQKFAWTLTKPTASKSALDKTDAAVAKFTPDVAGTYKVDVVVSNSIGSAPMQSVQIRTGTYVGAAVCASCHAVESREWAETGHGEIFKEEISGGADPATSHYGEGCLRCHTTGYYIGVKNGGFADVQAQLGWKFPALSVIQTGKAYDAVPAQLKAMGNIQCESCHGPAKEHVTSQAPMAKSLNEGVCNVCHNGGGHHIKGTQTQYAKHSEETAQAWTYPTGPSRQDCVRCHSGAGYISFTKNPTEKATWNNTAEPLMCASCHDPHSKANAFQLRIVGKPVEVAGITKDFGLSATCTECHWARNTGADAAKSAATPHYSVAAEMLANAGGVDYGQAVANSPHGTIVGAAPMKNAAGANLFGGNTPGPCVACHMYPTAASGSLQNKVGEHSWNMFGPAGEPYTAACASCHGNVTNFNFQAKGDFDGNGKMETVQAEMSGMLKVLVAAIEASSIKALEARPYFDQTNKANWTNNQKNAIYNYLFIRGHNDGKAVAAHNFKRGISLLQLSYKDLTGKDVPNGTLVK